VQTRPSDAAAIAPATCPACKSKISADGKTLHERSAYLEELLETGQGIEELEKHLSKLGKENETHQATIADLRGQLAEAQKKATPTKKENDSGMVQGQKRGNGERKPSWWD
jgi:regulator of replication initiation timing